MTLPAQRPFVKVLIWLVTAAFLLSLLGFIWGADVAKSVFLGCMVFTVPTLYFTLYAFRYTRSDQVLLMARSFYWGQTSKFSLMAVGFALVFVFVKPLNIFALFVGFCLMIPAHLMVAMFVSKNCSVTRSSAGQ